MDSRRSHHSWHAVHEGNRRRRNKTASERRAQQSRSDARTISRLAQGLESISRHRGNRLSKVGMLLKQAIEAEKATTSGAHGAHSATSSHSGAAHYGYGYGHVSGVSGSNQFWDPRPNIASSSGVYGQSEYYPWQSEHMGMPSRSPYAIPPEPSATESQDRIAHWSGDIDRLSGKLDEQTRAYNELSSNLGELDTKVDQQLRKINETTDNVTECLRALNQILLASAHAAMQNSNDMKHFNESVDNMHRLLLGKLNDFEIHHKQFEALHANGLRLLDEKVEGLERKADTMPHDMAEIVLTVLRPHLSISSIDAKLDLLFGTLSNTSSDSQARSHTDTSVQVSTVPQVQTVEVPQIQAVEKTLPTTKFSDPLVALQSIDATLDGFRMMLRQQGRDLQSLLPKADALETNIEKILGTVSCIEGALRATKITANFQHVIGLLESFAATSPPSG